jgi:hypothetical protein
MIKNGRTEGWHVTRQAIVVAALTVLGLSALAAEESYVATATNDIYALTSDPTPDSLKKAYATARTTLRRLTNDDKDFFLGMQKVRGKAADQRLAISRMKHDAKAFADSFLAPEHDALTKAGVSIEVSDKIVESARQFQQDLDHPIDEKKIIEDLGRMREQVCRAKDEIVAAREQASVKEDSRALRVAMGGVAMLIADIAIVELLPPVSAVSIAVGGNIVSDYLIKSGAK